MYQSGYIAIVGKSNVGKSTLINELIGQKVTIVSPKKQTTRENILGILTTEKYQLVFVDTPGIHKTKNKLDKLMMKNVRYALASVDVVFYMIDSSKKLSDDEFNNIVRLSTETPTIVGVSKSDLGNQENEKNLTNKLSEIKELKNIISFSTLKKHNLDLILQNILKLLPKTKEKNFYFEEDIYTDKSVRFLVSETIREQAFLLLKDELPYGIAVDIKCFKEEKNLVSIDVDLICERQNHKNIIIGKAGAKIKEISTKSRLNIEKLMNKKVMLTVWVKVNKN
ncbi:MAG: GTPase Era [Clostridia bacterium]|nr:GTPase Era [Clostridia bacterium]